MKKSNSCLIGLCSIAILLILVVLILMFTASSAEAIEAIPDGEGGLWVCYGWINDVILWIHYTINDPNIIYCFADS